MNRKPKIVISTCLLGKAVRYNGGHKYNSAIIDFFSDKVEWISICPEVEMGLTTPRPAMNLYRINSRIQLISIIQKNLTNEMEAWIAKKIIELKRKPVAAFILKSKSPSCGLGIPLYSASGKELVEKTNGLWAKAVLENFPTHPVCKESDLQTKAEQLAFLQKAIAHQKSIERNSTC